MHICFQYPLFALNCDLVANFQRICPIHVFAFGGFRPSYIEFCFQFSTDGVDCFFFYLNKICLDNARVFQASDQKILNEKNFVV
ncbi:unnamed protein product [Coffea canephora]|uniref:Uncharacterized protein n=1 Tax=Coffea canephora TaxID=49390 RepID=A0A068V1C9_COFCA|nr:unnamed protein product [Coffea canephora]